MRFAGPKEALAHRGRTAGTKVNTILHSHALNKRPISAECAAQRASSSSTSTAQPKGTGGGGADANTGTQVAILHTVREHSLHN